MTSAIRIAAFAALPVLLLASGCAVSPDGDFPSLDKRAVEGRFDVAETPIVMAAPGPLPTDIADRFVRWQADANAAKAAFDAALPAAERSAGAARNAAMGSEAWMLAQQDLSRLIAARAASTGTLADIDHLYVERQRADAMDGMPAIFALREVMAMRVAEEDSQIARLAGQLAH